MGAVKLSRLGRLLFCAIFFLPLVSCNLDLFGGFASTDLDERLRDQDVFNYLTYSDLNLALPSDYTFIMLSDTHITPEDDQGYEKIRDAITGTDKFVVVTGDLTDTGNRDALQRFIAVSKTFSVPCYPVLGNHDVYFGNWKEWRDLIGSSRYKAGGGSTRLIVLDTASSYFGASQLDWLSEQLKDAPAHVLIFTHTSLFLNSELDWEQLVDWNDDQERAKFLRVVGDSCDGVFMGHIHRRIEKEVKGVQYVAIEDYRSSQTYCRVHVSPSGITYEFHKIP